MLFQYSLDLVLTGRKTATSRLAKPEDVAVRDSSSRIEAVIANGRDKYRVGKTYAVQPARGKPAVARIRLLAIDAKTPAQVTHAEAHAEGFASREAFFETWHKIHGDKLHAPIWLLTFALVEEM